MFSCSSLLAVSLVSVGLYWRIGLKSYGWALGLHCLIMVTRAVTESAKLDVDCYFVDSDGGLWEGVSVGCV